MQWIHGTEHPTKEAAQITIPSKIWVLPQLRASNLLVALIIPIQQQLALESLKFHLQLHMPFLGLLLPLLM